MGEGGYGKVYKCVLKKELRNEDQDEFYAAKKIKLRHPQATED
jgi:hypothetical protein